MEQIHYIYKIVFLKGSLANHYYLGKRTSTIRKKKFEWSGYSTVQEWVLNEPMFDNYTGSGCVVKDYFKKYGKIVNGTFTKEILIISASFEENKLNEEFIVGDKYKTDPLCVNLIKGGLYTPSMSGKDNPTYRRKISDEEKRHLSEIMKERFSKIDMPWKGKKRTEEEKKNISEALKKYYKNNPDKIVGHKHSEEAKRLNSEAHKKLWENEEYRNKAINGMYRYYKTHDGHTKGRKMSEKTKEKLSVSFKGKPNYKNRGNNNGMFGKVPSNAKIILQLDKDGKLVKEWISMQEASRKLSLQAANIYKVCNGERNTCGGFRWSYK